MPKKPLTIDAAITWVDGNDPRHKAKMQSYLGKKSAVDDKTIKCVMVKSMRLSIVLILF